MTMVASQITSLTGVYSIVYSDADNRKHQSSASLAFVRGIHRGPVNSPHKWPVTRKMFPFDDVIMRKWNPFRRRHLQAHFLEWKCFELRLKFHWSLFLRVQLTIFQHWFRWWIGAVQATSQYMNQWWLVHWLIYASLGLNELTHWGRVTHICIGKLTIIVSDNGLSPGRRQAIIWTNAGIVLIWTLRKHFSEMISEIHKLSFKKCIWKCRLQNNGHLVSASMC